MTALRFFLLSEFRDLSSRDALRIASTLPSQFRWKRPREVSIAFVSLREMQALNKRYRGKNRPTDVLSFEGGVPASERGSVYLGDLVLCPAYAAVEAKRRGIELKEELIRLAIHGVLHLLGFDHATKEEELAMFGLQERWLSRAYDA